MSSETQEAIILVRQGVIEHGYRPVPIIEDPHYVKVKIEKTGICGSDIHYYLHGSIGPFVVNAPMVLGHESSGTVVEIGSQVTKVAVGDKVAIEPGVPSRYSEETKAGRYNLCREMKFAATPPYDGTLVKYYLSPEDFLTRLPEGVTLEEGALAEPLAVAVHANRLASTRFGHCVAIFGAGPVGLLTGSVARAFGATEVIFVDICEFKLGKAKDFGATHLFNSSGIRSPEDLLNKLQTELQGRLPEITFDCSGAEICIQTAVKLCKTGGTHVQVGSSSEYISFPMAEAITRELRILGSFRYAAGDYELAIRLIASKKVDVTQLVTHRFSFEEAIDAYNFNAKGSPGVIKTVIDGPK